MKIRLVQNVTYFRKKNKFQKKNTEMLDGKNEHSSIKP